MAELCADCRRDELLEGQVAQGFLDSLSAPVFVINEDSRLIGSNAAARKLVSWRAEIEPFALGGDVFGCAFAILPEGCGETVHCKECTIRNSVTHTLETGETLEAVPAYLNQRSEDAIMRIRFLITTENVGRFVLLRVDEIEPMGVDD